MIRYVIRRLLTSLVVIVIAAIVIFSIMTIVPGDPAEKYVGSYATQEEIELKRQAMGIDGTYLEQLGRFLYNYFIRFDFGTSWVYGVSVYSEVAKRLPVTILIGSAHLVFSIVIGLPVGIGAALHRGKWQDRVMLSLAMLGMSIPGFWVSMELIVLFCVKLRWLPPFGIGSWKHFILPCVGGILGGWAGSARQMRQSMLEVMRADYITTARAKGVSERQVIMHHMLPNALMPVITMIGGSVGGMITGSIATERVFSIPGVGTYLLTAISNLDYPVVEAITILLAAVNAICMLLVDLAYGFVDPRIKAQYVNSVKKGSGRKWLKKS